MLTGPEVRGCRPVLIHFANWKDREEVLAKSKLLRGTNIYVTEDLSRKIREHRNELNKFMREVLLTSLGGTVRYVCEKHVGQVSFVKVASKFFSARIYF